jgi:hypothetical protein
MILSSDLSFIVFAISYKWLLFAEGLIRESVNSNFITSV